VIGAEPILSAMIKYAVSSLGYRVVTAKETAEAITEYERAMNEIPTDLVVVDVTEGKALLGECFERLRLVDPNVKVIAAVDHQKFPDFGDFLPRGLHDVILKPCSMDHLETVIARALNNRDCEPQLK